MVQVLTAVHILVDSEQLVKDKTSFSLGAMTTNQLSMELMDKHCEEPRQGATLLTHPRAHGLTTHSFIHSV